MNGPRVVLAGPHRGELRLPVDRSYLAEAADALGAKPSDSLLCRAGTRVDGGVQLITVHGMVVKMRRSDAEQQDWLVVGPCQPTDVWLDDIILQGVPEHDATACPVCSAPPA